ncbi:SDR family NAD(P)-dependent oxidoreductase [Rathayibacter tanaceti]|uniref:Short-subunit dehydrogenase involved in D-alanine esterification of teichoic acids n=2 Tax=Rathayibacter tanaceti TaxID=1671680 RepID=A0ACD2XKM9_9MICO|nr:SDR family NAD(P)-dependent oxidoreductase [Rathayibacter tanaceti]KZX20725.1 putative oxidoreductase [Rathayibacter tanaceti]QHC54694.1 SDR family NAD(P)-dependent oxidoreductase [Rathayibacter tanaceti]TCO37494.1 short-subunit dehydrogenase involved in D-alanine esterification of teichoic acids [Rathayibacter tanaceti]
MRSPVACCRPQGIADRGCAALASPVAPLDGTISEARARERLAISHPDLNLLVANAGIQLLENVRDPDDVRIAEEQVTTNLLGTIRTIYAFLPQLVAQENAAILSTSSALAFIPFPATPTYSASKAAVHSFLEGLRVQLANSGVQVVEIVPPAVATTLLSNQDNPMAMPVNDFLTELVALLREHPEVQELVVENAKPIRDAVASGSYSQFLTMFSSF